MSIAISFVSTSSVFVISECLTLFEIVKSKKRVTRNQNEQNSSIQIISELRSFWITYFTFLLAILPRYVVILVALLNPTHLSGIVYMITMFVLQLTINFNFFSIFFRNVHFNNEFKILIRFNRNTN